MTEQSPSQRCEMSGGTLKSKNGRLRLAFLVLTVVGKRLDDDDVERWRDQGRVGQTSELFVRSGLVLREPIMRAVGLDAGDIVGFERGREWRQDQADDPQRKDLGNRVLTHADERPRWTGTAHVRDRSKICAHFTLRRDSETRRIFWHEQAFRESPWGHYCWSQR